MRRIGYGVVAACLLAAGLWPTWERAGLHRGGEPPGYVLFSPLLSGTTYLIDTSGRVATPGRASSRPGRPSTSSATATCCGRLAIHGHFFEVNPGDDTVWEYRNPFSGDAPNPAGDPPHSVFRATHIPRDHPALAGRDLVR